MNRLLTLCGLMLVLIMFGCGKSEESQPAQSAPEEKAKPVAEAVQEKAEEAAEQAGETADKVTEKAAEMAEKAEEAVKETAADAKEMGAGAVESSKEMLAKAEDKVVAAAESTKAAAGEAVEAVKQAVTPETVVLEASFGKVSMPHMRHADAYACATCHGDGVPGPFELGKERAHELCIGCHKQEGVGPTGCRDCHQK